MQKQDFFGCLTLSIPDGWAQRQEEDGRTVCFPEPGGPELWLDYQEISPPQKLSKAKLVEAARNFANALNAELPDRNARDVKLEDLADGAWLRYTTAEGISEDEEAEVRWWHRFAGTDAKVFMVTAQLMIPPDAAAASLLPLVFSLNKEMAVVSPRG